MRLVLLAAVAVAGCATPISRDEAMRRAYNTPDVDLCYLAATRRTEQVQLDAIHVVMQQRATNCSPYLGIIQARIAAQAQRDDAQMQLGLQLMQAGRAKPVPMPPTVVCRSQQYGNSVQTVCN